MASRVETKTSRKTGLEMYSDPIKVGFVELATPMTYAELSKVTPLGEFLNRRQMTYDSSVRVKPNGKQMQIVPADYVLQNGDIVMRIGKVDGGR